MPGTLYVVEGVILVKSSIFWTIWSTLGPGLYSYNPHGHAHPQRHRHTNLHRWCRCSRPPSPPPSAEPPSARFTTAAAIDPPHVELQKDKSSRTFAIACSFQFSFLFCFVSLLVSDSTNQLVGDFTLSGLVDNSSNPAHRCLPFSPYSY